MSKSDPVATGPDPTDWVGRSETSIDTVRVQPAQFMQALLGRDPDLALGDQLPPLWHWLYFLEAKPAAELGRDGHPRKGGFLPPVALPRRMWAGGRFEFHAPVRFGEEAQKVSTIVRVVPKQGRTGPLCFVTVLHEIYTGGILAVSEEQDIVYREDPAPDAPRQKFEQAPATAEIREIVEPTEVQLFRYSALTFNGHRIHYDIDYARAVEGYEALVVHGPLIATLLVDLASRTAGRSPRRFGFRALAPVTSNHAFAIGTQVDGTVQQLWAGRNDGALAMQAEADFSDN